jgi:uncharacterized membrane protein YqaE (UPF0057 family)
VAPLGARVGGGTSLLEVEMPHPYKLVLLIIQILLPYLVVAYRNRFDNVVATTLRFVLAVVVVWGWLLCTRLVVDYIDVRLAVTPEEFSSIYEGDGARNAFVLLLGWIPAVAQATVSCIVAGWRYRVRTDAVIKQAPKT